jgi:hypothetical protein
MSTHTKQLPKTGDTLRCQKCGMEVKVSQDCKCDSGQPRLECCGQPLAKA